MSSQVVPRSWQCQHGSVVAASHFTRLAWQDLHATFARLTFSMLPGVRDVCVSSLRGVIYGLNLKHLSPAFGDNAKDDTIGGRIICNQSIPSPLHASRT
jgi:hypothetical protein